VLVLSFGKMNAVSLAQPGPAKRVELIIQQIESLPTLPVVAARLLQLTGDPESNAREIIQLVSSDQSLTARILSLACRANVGLRRETTTVEKAVLMLGLEAVRHAVLSIKVFEVFGPRRGQRDAAFDRSEFWKHCLAVACAAELLAREMDDRAAASEAFVCGLLHDLGKVALDVCLPKSFARVVRQTNSRRECIADVEREILGVDHTVIGRRLAERWQLPAVIAEAIWLHHHRPEAQPRGTPHARQIQRVYLADLLAREQHIGYSGNFVFDDRAERVADRLGVRPDGFQRVLAGLPQMLEERAELLGLQAIDGGQLYVRAMAEANEELAQLNRSLSESHRKLQTRSNYFQAIVALDRQVSPRSTVQQVCVAAAQAVRTALCVEAVAVIARSPGEAYAELGVVTPADTKQDLLTLPAEAIDAEPIPAGLLGVAPLGSFLVPADSAECMALLRTLGGALGSGPFWVLPLVREQQWVGGAVFGCEPGAVREHQADRDELQALSNVTGLALANAQARAAAMQFSEELAEVNRKIQQMQSELLRTRSLSMIAEMAAGAAHELNSPLAVISGRAQLLADRAEDTEMRKALAVISEQAARCSEIVSELMEFARPAEPAIQAVDLPQLVQSAVERWRLAHQLESRQAVVEAGPAPPVFADPAQIEAVLVELLNNALAASEPLSAEIRINCPARLSDEELVVTVSDAGRGMEPVVLQRAFDPFYSHRPAGRGRGLGLPRAYRLVEANRGRLWLESRPAQGAVAYLALPRTQPGQAPSSEQNP
jgi:putative nucleotidyltransferase with HDIG domain